MNYGQFGCDTILKIILLIYYEIPLIWTPPKWNEKKNSAKVDAAIILALEPHIDEGRYAAKKNSDMNKLLMIDYYPKWSTYNGPHCTHVQND